MAVAVAKRKATLAAKKAAAAQAKRAIRARSHRRTRIPAPGTMPSFTFTSNSFLAGPLDFHLENAPDDA